MDEFHFDDRLFYRFNSYNNSLLGDVYKGLLFIDTNIPPNEIRKIAFYYDLYFPDKLEDNGIDIFEKNIPILEKKLYSYFNPWITESSELYKFYYCFNHTFTEDIYNKLILALENDDYVEFSQIPKKYILEIYKYLLTFYPTFILGKTGNFIKNQILKKSYIPMLTNWKYSKDKKDYLSFSYYKDFYWGNDVKLSKIERQNIFDILKKNKKQIINIYEILNGLKLKNIFSNKIFDVLLFYSCKHANYWYEINYKDFESLVSLFEEFYNYKVENFSKDITKHRREEIQEFFCKYENDVNNIIKNHEDIRKGKNLFDEFKKDHNKMNNPNFFITVAFYYNIMFPNEINNILEKIDSISQNIQAFFDNKSNKQKFMDKIDKISKINFSKEFNDEFFKVKDPKIKDSSLSLTVLKYIINAYDIFFPNEVKDNDMLNVDTILTFLKNKLENVIKLYYICNNKKKILFKDKIFTSEVYYEIMMNSCTYGKDGWWNVSDEDYDIILQTYEYLNIDKNTVIAQYKNNKEAGYKYFIRNKDKLHELIIIMNKVINLQKIPYIYGHTNIDNIAYMIVELNKIQNLETRDKVKYFIEVLKSTYNYNTPIKEIIEEEKEINNQKYFVYKIRLSLYYNFIDHIKTIREKYPIIVKIINKNFLNPSTDFSKFNIPQDTLLYIAKKYDLEFPNEIKYKNYIIKKNFKMLEFILPPKPLPLLQYLMNFFAKETLKLKILYEKLNNITHEENIKKQKGKDDKGKGDKGDGKGDDKGDKGDGKGDDKGDKGDNKGDAKQKFINKVKEIANDDTKLENFKNNLLAILKKTKDNIDYARDNPENNNEFYIPETRYNGKLQVLEKHVSDFLDTTTEDTLKNDYIKDKFLLKNIDENKEKSVINLKIPQKYFNIFTEIIDTFTNKQFDTNRFKYTIVELIVPEKQNEESINDLIKIFLIIFGQLGFIKNFEIYKIDNLNKLKLLTVDVGKHLCITSNAIEELKNANEDKKKDFFDFLNFYSKFAFVFIVNKNNKLNPILASIKNNRFKKLFKITV